jgi:hypothetical protein
VPQVQRARPAPRQRQPVARRPQPRVKPKPAARIPSHLRQETLPVRPGPIRQTPAATRPRPIQRRVKPKAAPRAVQKLRKPVVVPKTPPAEVVQKPRTLRSDLKGSSNLQRAIIYSEILGKPLALRDM